MELQERCGLDEALKPIRLDQRVSRLVKSLKVPEAEDRKEAAEDLGEIGSKAKEAVQRKWGGLGERVSEDRRPTGRTEPKVKVFLCHASGDKPQVRELYKKLRDDGFEPWLDEEDLLPGQLWNQQIPRALRRSDVVIVCLSRRSVTKSGYVQKEIKSALDTADEHPKGAIFLIPARLEEVEVPERLAVWHWVDLFEKRGYDRLLRALKQRSVTLGRYRRGHDI